VVFKFVPLIVPSAARAAEIASVVEKKPTTRSQLAITKDANFHQTQLVAQADRTPRSSACRALTETTERAVCEIQKRLFGSLQIDSHSTGDRRFRSV
jgi:hypothetical protein